jgi:hypothetical protein
MTKAAGFYNSLLECDEFSNRVFKYRKKPLNYGEFKTPRVVETMKKVLILR